MSTRIARWSAQRGVGDRHQEGRRLGEEPVRDDFVIEHQRDADPAVMGHDVGVTGVAGQVLEEALHPGHELVEALATGRGQREVDLVCAVLRPAASYRLVVQSLPLADGPFHQPGVDDERLTGEQQLGRRARPPEGRGVDRSRPRIRHPEVTGVLDRFGGHVDWPWKIPEAFAAVGACRTRKIVATPGNLTEVGTWTPARPTGLLDVRRRATTGLWNRSFAPRLPRASASSYRLVTKNPSSLRSSDRLQGRPRPGRLSTSSSSSTRSRRTRPPPRRQ